MSFIQGFIWNVSEFGIVFVKWGGRMYQRESGHARAASLQDEKLCVRAIERTTNDKRQEMCSIFPAPTKDKTKPITTTTTTELTFNIRRIDESVQQCGNDASERGNIAKSGTRVARLKKKHHSQNKTRIALEIVSQTHAH